MEEGDQVVSVARLPEAEKELEAAVAAVAEGEASPPAEAAIPGDAPLDQGSATAREGELPDDPEPEE
jgi:hypothetical protein